MHPMHPMDDDDVDVLERLGHVARTERASLVRVARAEGLGPEDAVDCVHDALCTFLRQSEIPDDLPAFLATIVRNAARNKRRLHHVAKPHDAIDAIERGSTEPLPEEMIAKAEEHVRLRACVDRLCETQKAVVTLRMLDERDGEDVAALLGITRGYVDVLLHRAKDELFVCMTE